LHALFNHPAVQAGLIPFIAALLSAELLLRLRLSGLAIVAGFAATAYFAGSFALEPHTVAQKIVWLGIASGVLAIPLTLLNWTSWRYLLTALAAGSAVWLTWGFLQQRALTDAVTWAAVCAIYTGWLVFWFDGLKEKSVAAGNAGMALGVGTGLAAFISAVELPGIFGLAAGAAATGYLFLQIITNNRLPCGRSFTLPLSLIAGLVASFAVVSSHQPWYTLAALGMIPLAGLIPVPEKWAIWLQSLTLSLLTAGCAAGAVYMTWHPPF
jgi:hypothetical protein